MFLGGLAGSELIYGSDWFYPRYVDRFRLTITVDIDGQKYSGSNVYEITWKPGAKWLAGLGSIGAPEIAGEALFIDLQKRGALVLTLRDRHTPNGRWIRPTGLLDRPVAQVGNYRKFPKYSGGPSVMAIPPSELWTMLYFKNPNDPESYQVIDPEDVKHLFYASLTNIAIIEESTKNKTEMKILKSLPWLDAMSDADYIGRSTQRPYYEYHQKYDFMRGI